MYYVQCLTDLILRDSFLNIGGLISLPTVTRNLLPALRNIIYVESKYNGIIVLAIVVSRPIGLCNLKVGHSHPH